MTEVKQKPDRDYRLASGKRVPGVTTCLSHIGWKTPGLVWWSFRLGQAHPELRSPYDVTEEAAGIGTVVHRAVELLMHGLPEAEAEAHIRDSLTGESRGRAESALLAFYQWRDGYRLAVLDTEVKLVSETHEYGGTIDYIASVAGKRAIVDLKTSSGIYPDMWAQVAAYGRLWEECHPDEPLNGGYYILRIDKETGGFDYSYRPVLSQAWQAFLCARQLYDLKKGIR